MYIRRRVCAEQNMKGGLVHVWVYQESGEDLSDLIAVSEFNLGLGLWSRCPGIDMSPSQETLPGCVWQGRSESIIDMTLCITHCMVFNVSKCWYSPVLSRETTGGSDRNLARHGRFRSPHQAVDFLTDPERGLGVCSEDDLEKAFRAVVCAGVSHVAYGGG